MIDVLVVLTVGLSLVLAGWALVEVVRNRPMAEYHVIGAGVVELALLVQAVVAVVLLIAQGAPPELGVYLTYLVISLLVVPVALVWSLAEKTRWGTAVLVVGALTVPVLVIRLQQLWEAGGV